MISTGGVSVCVIKWRIVLLQNLLDQSQDIGRFCWKSGVVDNDKTHFFFSGWQIRQKSYTKPRVNLPCIISLHLSPNSPIFLKLTLRATSTIVKLHLYQFFIRIGHISWDNRALGKNFWRDVNRFDQERDRKQVIIFWRFFFNASLDKSCGLFLAYPNTSKPSIFNLFMNLSNRAW